MNLDEALAEMERTEAAFNAAIEKFKAEQAAGGLGLDPYKLAQRLNEELIALGASITGRMDEELASL